ncbi:hypothetical protein HYV50_05105 [Candidatus Pacearchaeota archaeon]|nr:hypothetical protein [Candidatus Pacearchaeota archaeon]
MDYLGHEARIIEPQGIDHALAEYTTSEGYKIVVDPSSNDVGINLNEWAKERNVTKKIAEYPDGEKKDVTRDFLE